MLEIQIPGGYWISKYKLDILPDIQLDIGYQNLSQILDMTRINLILYQKETMNNTKRDKKKRLPRAGIEE